MDGLNQLTAAGHLVTLAGRAYHLSPLTLSDYGQIENQILAARPDPRDGIRRLAGLDPEEQRRELGQIYDAAAAASRVTLGDLDRWWQTPAGVHYRLWLMLRKHQPAIALQEAAALAERLSDEECAELVRRMEDCRGLPSANELGHTEAAGEAAGRAAALPWSRWACRLSRLYGWTPAEIGRLTVAQMWIYLTEPRGSGERRRMSAAAAAAYCEKRRLQRENWIRQTMEKLP